MLYYALLYGSTNNKRRFLIFLDYRMTAMTEVKAFISKLFRKMTDRRNKLLAIGHYKHLKVRKQEKIKVSVFEKS